MLLETERVAPMRGISSKSMRGDSRTRFQVLGAAVLFSTDGVAIEMTTLLGLEVASARSAIAAIAIWLLVPTWRRFWRPESLLVGACYASTLVCFVVATKYTMAANAIFLQSTAPVYVLLLAPRLLNEPNRRSDYVVTLLLLAEPVLNGAWAWLVLGEQPGPWSLISCAVIISATFARVVMWSGRSGAPDAAP